MTKDSPRTFEYGTSRSSAARRDVTYSGRTIGGSQRGCVPSFTTLAARQPQSASVIGLQDAARTSEALRVVQLQLLRLVERLVTASPLVMARLSWLAE